MYTLVVDNCEIPITDFSENLDGNMGLNVNVSNNNLNLEKTSFRSLSDIKEAMKDGVLNIKVIDDNDVIIWQNDNYSLSGASFSINESGIYFNASFSVIEHSVVNE